VLRLVARSVLISRTFSRGWTAPIYTARRAAVISYPVFSGFRLFCHKLPQGICMTSSPNSIDDFRDGFVPEAIVLI